MVGRRLAVRHHIEFRALNDENQAVTHRIPRAADHAKIIRNPDAFETITGLNVRITESVHNELRREA